MGAEDLEEFKDEDRVSFHVADFKEIDAMIDDKPRQQSTTFSDQGFNQGDNSEQWRGYHSN